MESNRSKDAIFVVGVVRKGARVADTHALGRMARHVEPAVHIVKCEAPHASGTPTLGRVEPRRVRVGIGVGARLGEEVPSTEGRVGVEEGGCARWWARAQRGRGHAEGQGWRRVGHSGAKSGGERGGRDKVHLGGLSP